MNKGRKHCCSFSLQGTKKILKAKDAQEEVGRRQHITITNISLEQQSKQANVPNIPTMPIETNA